MLQGLEQRLKRTVVASLARPYVRRGFTTSSARRWIRAMYQDWQHPHVPRRGLPGLHRGGFTSRTYAQLSQRGQGMDDVVSEREYALLRPFNKSRAWLRNRIVAERLAPELGAHMNEPVATLARRNGEPSLEFLAGRIEREAEPAEAVAELAKEHGLILVEPMAWGRGPSVRVQWTPQGLTLDGWPVRWEVLEADLAVKSQQQRWAITVPRASDAAGSQGSVFRFYLGATDDGGAVVLDVKQVTGEGLRAPSSEAAELIDDVEEVFGHPRLTFTFLAVEVTATNGAFTVQEIDPAPDFPNDVPFSDDANEYLRRLSEERRGSTQPIGLGSRLDQQRRRLIRRTRAFRMRADGFTGRGAKTWLNILENDRPRADAYSRQERVQAYEWGFTPDVVRNFGITAANRKNFISIRDYMYARPFNGKYGKWVRDRVSALMVFEPFQEYFDAVHFQMFRRGDAIKVVPISAQARAAGGDFVAVAEVAAKAGTLTFASAGWKGADLAQVGYQGSRFHVNGTRYTTAQLRELINAQMGSGVYVLKQARTAGTSSGMRVKVVMTNADGSRPQIAEAHATVAEGTQEPDGRPLFFVSDVDPEDGTYRGARTLVEGRVEHYDRDPLLGKEFEGKVSRWQDIRELLAQMCRFAPQLRFVQFTLEVDDENLRIVRVTATPTYSRIYPFSHATVELLRSLVIEKREQSRQIRARAAKAAHNTKLKIRREFASALYPRGLVPYQSVRWIGDMRRDLFQRSGIPLGTKLWAYRNGFLSYRLPQYGITAQNREQYISDFEYRWLRHINERYKYWLEDKVSIKYVAADFNEFLPGYYFYTTRSHGVNRVVPMMDCPAGYGEQYEDVLRLARVKGVLALKPDQGSHGDGFYRLAWESGEYFLNGERASEDEIVAILADPENRYLITEFIDMHPVLSKIYPNSVNTIRIIVFKRDGITPELGNAYLRVGSTASGYVDNTAAGGMLAEIDVESGAFGNAKALVNGRVEECPIHPDTGVEISGEIPNWGYVKEQVLRMAESFYQLEYLGFDVAITPDGFKLPEINRFPDFPRIDKLTPATIDYLLLKLEQKKRRYGYHKKRPRTLFSLPKREHP